MTLVAHLFGVPASVVLPTLADFHEYWAAQLAGNTLTVTAPAREVAAVILEAALPARMRLIIPAHRLATAGLLPPRLREEYGLGWNPFHEFALPSSPARSAPPPRRYSAQLPGSPRPRPRSLHDPACTSVSNTQRSSSSRACHGRPDTALRCFVHSAERRLSVCWSKNEREQWERERFEREAERLARISSTGPKANEPEPQLETEEREGELIRS
jgi:hypothetical protein